MEDVVSYANAKAHKQIYIFFHHNAKKVDLMCGISLGLGVFNGPACGVYVGL